ncbi:MAG TPA: hypothetical protein VF556_02805 [Pyrinomonadaceae bacterium]|jgi:hypothetical protein
MKYRENFFNSDSTGDHFSTLESDKKSMLFLVPLVQTAWAHGAVSPREKQVIFEAAREEGIDEKHDFNSELDRWLVYQPSQEFFDDCLEQIENEMRAMTVKERGVKLEMLLRRCERVAASAGEKSRMDVNHAVSPEEKNLLAAIKQTLSF